MAIFGLVGESLATLRIVLVVVPAFFLYGYNQSNIGGVLDYPSFIKHFPEIDDSTTEGAVQAHNATVQGTVVAIYTIGCLFGALAMAPLGNRIGRRRGTVVGACIATVGMILQATSYSLPQLIVGRIVSGIGNGGVNAIVPVWQSECTQPRSRGKNVVVVGVFIASGVALASWVNVGLSYISESEVAWRLPLALPIAFCIMLVCFIFSFPESPRWLISKGRIDEARDNMRVLADCPPGDDALDREIAAIRSLVHEGGSGAHAEAERGFGDFFKRGEPNRLFYRLCLAVGVNFCAQMTGANAITYYGKKIFESSLHMPEGQAALLNAGLLTWKIVAAAFAFMTIDRLGRKPLFIVSGGGMALSMAGLAGTVWAIDNHNSFGVGVAAVFFLFLFMAFFPLGFLAANFLYSAEIAPQDLRAHLAAVGTASHWLFNFVIAEITPVAFVTITWRYYIVYACIGSAVVPIVYFFFPETKGLSLEAMTELFSTPESFLDVPAYARQLKNRVDVPGASDEKDSGEEFKEKI